MTVAEIQKRVRVILNQNTDSAEFDDLGTSDVLGIDEVIAKSIVPAATQVAASAPLGMCVTKELANDGDVSYKEGYCEIMCPAEMLKLGSVKMQEWAISLYTLTPTTSDIYKRQFSPVRSSHATPTRPVMALVEGANNANVLQLFPAETGTIEYASYVPRPAMSEDGLNLENQSPQLCDAMCYQCAALTCLALDEIDKYNALTAMTKTLISNE